MIRGRTLVLVVGTDRALRANLTTLLRLEHDLCVEECSTRDASQAAARLQPEVVLVCGPWPGPEKLAGRQIHLADRTPYEIVLKAIRGEDE